MDDLSAGKKEGTAAVSMKIGGKTCTTNVTVTKYVNPVKSVKFGNNFISGSKFNRSSRISLFYAKFAGKKVKTNITLKKGWKLSRFYFRNRQNKYQWNNGFEYFPQEGKDTTEGIGIANGKKFLYMEKKDLFFSLRLKIRKQRQWNICG